MSQPTPPKSKSQSLTTRALTFEKKNQDMIKLPKHARVQKRPIPHAPIASPYAGPHIPKTVYVSTKSPFMAAVKRVQKLLRQAEQRATASVNLTSSKLRDRQRLGELARSAEGTREEVFVKATGRAMERALSVGRWFEERGGEYVVRVKTGSVLVVDDVVEDEGAKLEEEKKSAEDGDGDGDMEGGAGGGAGEEEEGTDRASAKPKPSSKSAAKKRKRAAKIEEGEELPETRTRWVNMVELAVALK